MSSQQAGIILLTGLSMTEGPTSRVHILLVALTLDIIPHCSLTIKRRPCITDDVAFTLECSASDRSRGCSPMGKG